MDTVGTCVFTASLRGHCVIPVFQGWFSGSAMYTSVRYDTSVRLSKGSVIHECRVTGPHAVTVPGWHSLTTFWGEAPGLGLKWWLLFLASQKGCFRSHNQHTSCPGSLPINLFGASRPKAVTTDANMTAKVRDMLVRAYVLSNMPNSHLISHDGHQPRH